MSKHHDILGLKHCGDADTREALFISIHQLTAGVAAGVDAAQDSAQPCWQRLMTASDWCQHSAVGRVHSLRSCRMCLEEPAWVTWLTVATRTMLELWRQLMTVPLVPAILLP